MVFSHALIIFSTLALRRALYPPGRGPGHKSNDTLSIYIAMYCVQKIYAMFTVLILRSANPDLWF